MTDLARGPLISLQADASPPGPHSWALHGAGRGGRSRAPLETRSGTTSDRSSTGSSAGTGKPGSSSSAPTCRRSRRRRRSPHRPRRIRWTMRGPS